jgi:hypothetical protein
MFTAIPIVILSLVSLGGRSTDFTEGLGVSWLVAGSLWVIAVLTAIGFAIRRRKEISSGILVGVAIGFFSLVITCIASFFLDPTHQ